MKYLYAGLAGILIAVLIFWAGMSYNQYKISHSPEVITVDTTNHSFNLPLIDTVITPVIVYKPDYNRQKYIDSLIIIKKNRDSLELFIMQLSSQFGEIFTDSVKVKDSLGTFEQVHVFNILADPLYSFLQKTDIRNDINYTSYDTTRSKYIVEEPSIWDRLKDVGIVSGFVFIIYFLISAL